MTHYLTFSEQELKQNNAYWTAKEIAQQPQAWQQVLHSVEQQREALDSFLAPILAQPKLRIIYTGAGTSAYVGDAVAPEIAKITGRTSVAISTTNIVSNPENYLLAEYPTLVISYARSGNSPESLAAVELADSLVDNCYHLIITCNPEGELATGSNGKDNRYTLLMPQQTLDQSFAMTSSFTSMLVATMCVFSTDSSQLLSAIKTSDVLLENQLEEIKQQAENMPERVVFLGSGPLLGIAKEAALKCLELTAGQVFSYCESPLGFRHGPKSLVNGNTDIFVMMSNDEYTRKYDSDLLSELQRDGIAKSIYVIDQSAGELATKTDDIWASLPYIVHCQLLSFYKSLQLSLTPDNPCPSGEVNRVVQGVTIYPHPNSRV
ncbi:SIS domain-containing protein [Thalassotalea marina]|uniref:Tagatose-6-phosphate ketose isomerase n=1 Tax=Thalassotalea marina TaxID=1673741 RepID=A0A919BM79_9GAMM|nr:SIS domain-containing protein [Thalassotalea marina]GHG00784.1 tagatose-6-phosphate ketose isomerase [Thalassotalea marina]